MVNKELKTDDTKGRISRPDEDECKLRFFATDDADDTAFKDNEYTLQHNTKVTILGEDKTAFGTRFMEVTNTLISQLLVVTTLVTWLVTWLVTCLVTW